MPSLSRTINIKRLTRNKIIGFKFKVSSFKLKHAFTLIELLVVVAIMAVLAAAIVYSTNNARAKGKDARRKQDMQALSTALVSYYADHHQYPLASPNPDIVLDYSSDSVPVSPETSWIPGLSSYMNKIPKDPLQAIISSKLAQAIKKPFVSLAGIFSHIAIKTASAAMTEVCSDTQNTDTLTHNCGYIKPTGTLGASQDISIRTIQGENANNVDKINKGKAIGRNNNCSNDPTEYSFRFTLNQGLINNPHIDSAKILFTPRNSAPDQALNNTPMSTDLKTQFRVELAQAPSQVTDGNNWGSRTKSNSSVPWETIGAWTDSGTQYASPELNTLIQELVSKYPGVSIHFINVFWENKNPGHCGGRIPDIDPDSPDDTPPVIIIDTSTPLAPVCTPTTHSPIFTGETANFYASGGSGPYSWAISPPTQVQILSGSDGTQHLQVSLSPTAPTTYTVTVTRGGQSGPCTVQVVIPTLPGDTPGDVTTTNTACNAKSNIFCYRVSVDKKHFIIWAQLENRNDPDIYNSSQDSAVCNDNDLNLHPPTDSYLNYCLLSPK